MRLLIFMIFLTVGSVHADSAVAPVKLKVFRVRLVVAHAKWIDQLNEQSFDAVGINLEQLSKFKASRGILPKYQSYHTALSSDGFVFEGHIPARYITEFLKNPITDSIGLAVQGCLLVARAWK